MQDDPKPDLARGVPFDGIPDHGLLAGTFGNESVILVRSGDAVRAFGGNCTHLGAPLEKGLVVDGTIRCPWHHACFDLRSGEALTAPAFDSLPCWAVERRGDHVAVTGRAEAAFGTHRSFEGHSQPGWVIVGGGAAGYACAHEARRLGHEGPITLISSEGDQPYDRTLLTKDYLDGSFGDDRLPIARTTLDDLGVTSIMGTPAQSIEPAAHRVTLANGQHVPFTKLLLATGAEPNRLGMPGHGLPHVHVLRSLSDCRRFKAMLGSGRRVVVVGGSFIGLETAASMRTLGCEVTVVTPDREPMARVLGPELSRAILDVHTRNGVVFRVGSNVAAITREAVTLADGLTLPADVVVVGIGVKPRVELAERAGLTVEDGVVVDALLRTSDPDIFAAGDIAYWPDRRSRKRLRVEHWAVAERQGQIAARNMLGGSEPYAAVPFFWSKHFDFSFRYVGHADDWDEIVVEGDLDSGKATLHYRRRGSELAVATVEQDLQALLSERAMEAEPR